MHLGIGLGITHLSGVLAAPFSPLELFASGEEGAWYDPSDSSTVWQDAAGTTPAGVGDPVGRIDDKSGNGNHATQATSTARPTLQSSGGLYYLDFDGVDDYMDVAWASSLAQPNSFALAGALNTTANKFHFDGFSSDRNTLYNAGSTSGITLFAGSVMVYGLAANDGSAHVWSGLFDTTSSFLNRDGITLTPTAGSSPGSNASDGLTLGANNTKTNNANNDVYGLVFVDRTLTTAEIEATESYLATKSGVTLP